MYLNNPMTEKLLLLVLYYYWMVAAVSTALHIDLMEYFNELTMPFQLPSPISPLFCFFFYSFSSSSSSSFFFFFTRFMFAFVSKLLASMPTMTQSDGVSPTLKRSKSLQRRSIPPTSPKSRINQNGSEHAPSAQKQLFTSTARSLSVSFQGESFSLQFNRVKTAPPQRSPKKATTPERKKPGSKNPERLPLQGQALNHSFDGTEERRKLSGSNGYVTKALQNLMTLDVRAFLNDKLPGLNSKNRGARKCNEEWNGNVDGLDSYGSDTESVDSSSVSSSILGAHDRAPGNDNGNCNGGGRGQRVRRGIVVPARFLQESNSWFRHNADPPKNLSSENASCPPPKGALSGKRQSSRVHAAVWPGSPGKCSAPASPVREGSPRTSNATANNGPSVMTYAADLRRTRVGEKQIDDAHELRLLYNRLLQWRFVNARAEDYLCDQELEVERSLWDAWVIISILRESVKSKRIELEFYLWHLKLTSLVEGQMMYLERWSSMEEEYSSCLSGAMIALEANALRLPVVDGARADIHDMKKAISSAADVILAMESTCLFLSKAEEMKSLMAELARLTAKERALLNTSRDLLSTIVAMQVEECSLRTRIIQMNGHLQDLR